MSLMAGFKGSDGKRLICHCPAGLACHADVLIEEWHNARTEEEQQQHDTRISTTAPCSTAAKARHVMISTSLSRPRSGFQTRCVRTSPCGDAVIQHPGPPRPFQRASPIPRSVSTGTHATSSCLSNRLAAAHPVVFKGRGECLQVPWTPPCRGFVLCVDLWSGFAGLKFGVLTLGFRAIAVCAGQDPDAQATVVENFPDAVSVPSVEDIKASDVEQVLQRRTFDFILCGGGSP